MTRIEVYSSSLESNVFAMAALGALVTERTEKVAPEEMPALSVGQRGVTPQLEGVAKQTTDGSRKLVRSGDLVINSRADRRGASGVASKDGSVSLVYSVMKPNLNILDPRFGHHLLRSVGFQEEFFRWGTGIVSDLWSTNFTRMGRIRVPIPSLPAQRCIADYLDRETGEIDAMIAKMDQLAEQLEARRIESITSGISGVKSIDRVQTGNIWFPTVPRGWRLSSVQLLSGKLTDGAHVSPETENGEYDFVSTRDVRNGVIDFEGSLKTNARSYEYLVRSGCQPSDGDILFSKDGTIGETAIVVGTPEFVVASSLIIVTPTRTLVNPEFLRYALESGPAQRAARSFTRGSGLPRISVVNFGRGVPVPVPPTLDEQQRIADHLDLVTSRIDKMLAKVAELKSLLTERRAALITEVVTGRKEVA